MHQRSWFPLAVLLLVFIAINIHTTKADGYGHGHGHGHHAKGTACIVKGSYCNCHYCKCEKGHVHCGGYGKGGYGKKYFWYEILIIETCVWCTFCCIWWWRSWHFQIAFQVKNIAMEVLKVNIAIAIIANANMVMAPLVTAIVIDYILLANLKIHSIPSWWKWSLAGPKWCEKWRPKSDHFSLEVHCRECAIIYEIKCFKHRSLELQNGV